MRPIDCLLVITAASALPLSLVERGSGAQNVVYWGQDATNKDLTTYCNSSAGIDILVLAFLYDYGDGAEIPYGSIGDNCVITAQVQGQQCEELASAITACQSKGVKVILSLGGAVGNYSLSSQQEAETIGENLWQAYGNTVNTSVARPFGNSFVNGWDFDIESNNGNEYYQYMISTLRSKFASDAANKYYITGAPQCPIPEPNMGEIISAAQFDYLWVQFYNNEGCSVDGPINFDDWKTYISNGSSSAAKIFIGVPASPDAATGSSAEPNFYLAPTDLAKLVDEYSTDPVFGGTMMWSAGYSDSNVNNGCTYAQEAKHILETGSAC